MKFFKVVAETMGRVSKQIKPKLPVIGKTICGKDVPPHGYLHWGKTSANGSALWSHSEHDVESKIDTEKQVEAIKQRGGIPQVDIIWSRKADSKDPFNGTRHKYTWCARDISVEVKPDAAAPHV